MAATDYRALLRLHKQSDIYPISLILGALILLSNSIIPVTRWVLRRYAPPSDQALQRLFCVYVGTWEYLPWLYKVAFPAQRIQYALEHGVNFCYVAQRTSEDRSGWSVEWDWDRPEWRSKPILKLEHPATAGQVIQMWTRFWGPNGLELPDWSEINRQTNGCLRMFNHHLRVEDAQHHSGLLFPLVGPRLIIQHEWLGIVGQEEPLRATRAEPEPATEEEPSQTWES